MSATRRLSRPVHRDRQHRGHRPPGRAPGEPGPGHAALVTLPAQLDLLTASQAGDQLRAALIRREDVVIVDLTGTCYCDVAAARMLLGLHADATADGAQLRIAVPAGPVRRVLELLGLDRQLNLYPTVGDAGRSPVMGRP